MPESPVYERLTQAVLEAVADDILVPGSSVAALYCGFDSETIDSLSIINLDEHLNRLTGRDLRQLETRVPLDTLKVVVDLAVEISREGGRVSRSAPCWWSAIPARSWPAAAGRLRSGQGLQP